MLILERPWTRQPQGAASLDFGNPISSALVFAFLGSDCNWRNIVTNTQPTSTTGSGGAFVTVGSGGVGVKGVTGSDGTLQWPGVITTSNGAGTGDFTFVSVGSPISEASVHGMMSQATGGSQQGYLIGNSAANYSASAGSLAFGSVGGMIAAAGVIDGKTHVFVGVRSGTTHYIDVDGRQVATGTKSAGSITGTAPFIQYNGIKSYGSYTRANHPVWAQFGFNRALTETERASIGRNPWQLFKSLRIPIPTAAAAAGVPMLSASTYVTGSLTSTGWRPQVTAS